MISDTVACAVALLVVVAECCNAVDSIAELFAVDYDFEIVVEVGLSLVGAFLFLLSCLCLVVVAALCIVVYVVGVVVVFCWHNTAHTK